MTIKQNDLIKDFYGEWHKVLSISGNCITTYEMKHIHITKIAKVVTK